MQGGERSWKYTLQMLVGIDATSRQEWYHTDTCGEKALETL
jgi:hypothetical protein